MASILKTGYLFKHLSMVLLLAAFCFTSKAQEKHTGMGTGGTTHSEQADAYRSTYEKPSGYDVPDGGLISQPWVWTLVTAGIVLAIGVIYKANTDNQV
jgi:hypothetical protein